MISEVSILTDIPAAELLGRSRVAETATARQLYWKLLREKKRYSFHVIAALCERDHSTIVNGIKRVNGLLESGDLLAVELWNKIKDIKK